MKKKFCLLSVCLLLSLNSIYAQTDSMKLKSIIGIDLAVLLNQQHPGLHYMLETRHMQYRCNLEFAMSQNSYNGKTHTSGTFTPYAGAAWIHSTDRFSFYAGTDIFYAFSFAKNQDNLAYNTYTHYYGFEPVIGFRYPVHNRFFVSLEAKSLGLFSGTPISYYNSGSSAFNFKLLGSYCVILSYAL